jgi:dihydrofolate reductase
MTTLVVQEYLSLDGVMQSPGAADDDREGEFDLGGWMSPYFDPAIQRAVIGLHRRADALLLGRKTYDTMAAYFPFVTDDENPSASTMNGLRKYVVSRTLASPEWGNTEVIKGDIPASVEELKRQPGGEIQVIGSGQLVQELMRNGLVDSYRLWIFPVLLGRGKRLFSEGTLPTQLRLTDTDAFGNGVVMQEYASR